MTEISHPFNAVQCARLMLALCTHSAVTLQRGYCIGDLRPRDLIVESGAVGACATAVRVRRRAPRPHERIRHRISARRHARRGHDSGCRAFGVPLPTLQRLLEAWGGEDAASFLIDIVQEAIDQLLLGGWGNLTPNEVLRHEIGRRLTLEPPADLLRDQTALNQIPSEPSKSASSRRALTWLKKRAASAPSTMR